VSPSQVKSLNGKNEFTDIQLKIEQELMTALMSPEVPVYDHIEQQMARFEHAYHVIRELVKMDSGGLNLFFGVYMAKIENFFSSVSARELQKAGKKNIPIYDGFDSWEGLEEDWDSNFKKGAFDTNGKLPLVNDNIELHQGYFEKTLAPFLKNHPEEPIRLLHVDCDLYSSTVTIFKECAERIVPGTIIVFDEFYNNPEYRSHELPAFVEFLESSHYEYKVLARSSDQQVSFMITGKKEG